MALHHPRKAQRSLPYYGFIFLTVVLIGLGLLGNMPPALAASGSGLRGLMVLKHMAKTAVPYDVALANANPTLIEFYADWCTTCQSMAPTLEKLHEKYGQAINFVMIDIDDPQWADPVKQFSVQGVPQLTLLSATQEPVETLVGKVPETILTQLLDHMRA